MSVNKKVISRDTQDVVLAPIAYWHESLKPNLNELLRRKGAQNRHIRCDDTTVVVSVNDRSERDLTKRFNDTNIDWSVIENSLSDGENSSEVVRNSGSTYRSSTWTLNHLPTRRNEDPSVARVPQSECSLIAQHSWMQRKRAAVIHPSGEMSMPYFDVLVLHAI